MITDTIDAAYERSKQRFSDDFSWYPYPVLIAFFAVLSLGAMIMLGLDTQAGHRVHMVHQDLAVQNEKDYILSIYPREDQLRIVTWDRRVFNAPLGPQESWDHSSLSEYLRDNAKYRLHQQALYGFSELTLAIGFTIAVDQRLSFGHLRGVIDAFADAGISHYGFESMVLTDARGEAL